MEKRAEQKARDIIDYLQKDDNRSLRDLAAVPMLLQIMAIIWKERDYLPRTRTELYDTALNYLLQYRDMQKRIDPLLPAPEARLALAPTALWMQEELQADEAPRKGVHEIMQPFLNRMVEQVQADRFCENLRDRAGLIADYDEEHYVFRHKSFREFLSAQQLLTEWHKEDRIETLVNYFKSDWWEEALRFFMNRSNGEIFDRFMDKFFSSPASRELNANQQNLLQHFVSEAPQRKIDALKEALTGGNIDKNQERYALDCLKTAGSPEALETIESVDKSAWSQENIAYAQDIVAEARAKTRPINERPVRKSLFEGRPPSFRWVLLGLRPAALLQS
jgi:hypothetical protein